MQDLRNSKLDDEIDLHKFFIALWAHKLFIICTFVISILCTGYYLFNVEKQYTSTAIFELKTNNDVALGGELAALANLANISNRGNQSLVSIDKIAGRIFIEELDAELNFQADPYFNTYNPNYVEPSWKSYIKHITGLRKASINIQEAIWQSIVKKYSKNVNLDHTSGGPTRIKVTHINADRAAEIANAIMLKFLNDLKKSAIKKNNDQLSYLSNTLANSLGELETSQYKLKDFKLKNSALPIENLAVEVLQLDKLRSQFTKTTELYEAMSALSLMLKKKTTEQENYLALRQQFPIVDQVEFRRVLGQNEIINSWSWPDVRSVIAVLNTLTERKNRLSSEINASHTDIMRLNSFAETYASLQRENKIAEATYTVILEQVKAQSIFAGFQPDNFEIFEYASASINPSAPKRSLILILGAILGLFLGAIVSLIFAMSRGVYYSKNSLRANVRARFTASVRSIMPMRKKNLDSIKNMLVGKPRSILRDITIEIHKSASTEVVVTSSRAKLTSNDAARALASYMQSNTQKIAVLDFSSKAKAYDIDDKRLSIGSFDVVEKTDNISVLRPSDDLVAMELLSQKDFWENTKSLGSTFDLVFLCADNADAISLLSALEGQKIFHITLARTKKTKSANLMHMHSLLPIQGLLHE